MAVNRNTLETDDFLRGKRMVEDGLRIPKGDAVLDLLSTYLREEVPSMRRAETGREILSATREKHSPIGWLKTVLERGNLSAALAANRAASVGRERRFATEEGRTLIEVRRRLKELYRAVSGEAPPTKLLDDEGGLEWRVFAYKMPSLAQAVRRRLDQRIGETRRDVPSDWGYDYSAVDPPSNHMMADVLDEFLQADGKRPPEVTTI